MEDYENSICCWQAEQDIIWTKQFLYKKNPPVSADYEFAPDISHLHEDWWMFDHIPF